MSDPRTEINLQIIPTVIQGYAFRLAEKLKHFLGDDLIGVFIGGSVALGGYVHGRSDIDIQAVCEVPLALEKKQELANALMHPSLPCSARGCEFVLYSREQLKMLSSEFELNLNSGPQMPLHATFNGGDEPTHWFLIDRDIMRKHGIAMLGEDPKSLFGTIPRGMILDAIFLSLQWHKQHDEDGYSGILSACRGWLFAEEDRWTSKVVAAEWAKSRVHNDSIIVHALALYDGLTDEELRAYDAEVSVDMIMNNVNKIRDNEP